MSVTMMIQKITKADHTCTHITWTYTSKGNM